jgi:hypothetical protein
VEVLKALELDHLLETRFDPVVRDRVRFALHIGRKGGAVAPAADHDYLTGFTVRLPDLEIDETVGFVYKVSAGAEGGNELWCTVLGDPEARH